MDADYSLTQFADNPAKRQYPHITWNASGISSGDLNVNPDQFWDTRVQSGNIPVNDFIGWDGSGEFPYLPGFLIQLS